MGASKFGFCKAATIIGYSEQNSVTFFGDACLDVQCISLSC